MSFNYPNPIKRLCIKLTGESLMEGKDSLATNAIGYVASQIKYILSKNIELCIVIGGGNIYRGVSGSTRIGVTPTQSDYMGMLATVINGLALGDFLMQEQIPYSLYSSFKVSNIVEEFHRKSAMDDMAEGKAVVFCGGTGHPYFTTDTASVLRSLEMNVDILLKATKVDGIYTRDPNKYSDAQKISILSYENALANNYSVMDQAAFALCKDNNMPLVITNFFNEKSFHSFLEGKIEGTLVLSKENLSKMNLKEDIV